MIYGLIQVKLHYLLFAKKSLKTGQISVRDFASARFTICVITFAIFSYNFQNQCKTKFLPYSTIGIFDFYLAINLFKFQNFPEKFWNLAAIMAEKFDGNSGDYHLDLSIDGEKSRF